GWISERQIRWASGPAQIRRTAPARLISPAYEQAAPKPGARGIPPAPPSPELPHPRAPPRPTSSPGAPPCMEDSARGKALLAVGTAAFTYYTIWLLLTPFVEDQHFLRRVFPPRRYAVVVPVVCGVALLCVTLVHLGAVIVGAALPGRDTPPQKAKKDQ
ncbi:unnamed protein product, partial [Ostreobium quekettii]